MQINVRKIRWRCFKRRYKIVTRDKSQARNKTTVLHVGLRRRAKSNEIWRTLKQMVACFFGKLVMWRLFHFSNVGRSNSFFAWSLRKIHTMNNKSWILVPWLKSAPFWAGESPYSLDLAPNGFVLFPHIKKILRGQRFSPNTIFLPNSIFKSSCKQHKLWSCVKTFWLRFPSVRLNVSTLHVS